MFFSRNLSFLILLNSINEITFASCGIDSSGFSRKFSKSFPTQKITSAFCIILAWDGLNVKLCGEDEPSKINFKFPLLPITLEIIECSG